MLESLGLLAGSALGRVGDVLDTPRRLAWQGINSILGNEDGPENGADLLSRAGMDPESVWTKALGMGVDALTDPLTYAGGFIGRGIGKAANAVSKIGKPGVANVLKARRNFAAVKDVGFPATGESFADAAERIAKGGDGLNVLPGRHALGRVVGPMHESTIESLAAGGLDDIAWDFGTNPAVKGMYDARLPAAFTAPGAKPEVIRHELVHGLNREAARESGAGLSLASKAIGSSYKTHNPFLTAMGIVGDEALAHGAHSRGVGNQIAGATEFLKNPHPHYVRQVSALSPEAGNLWNALRGAEPVSAFKTAGYFLSPSANNLRRLAEYSPRLAKAQKTAARVAPWAAAASVPAAGGAYALLNNE